MPPTKFYENPLNGTFLKKKCSEYVRASSEKKISNKTEINTDNTLKTDNQIILLANQPHGTC